MKFNKWILVIFIILISLVDLGANVLALIPGVGPVFESVGEAALEIMQIVLVAILAAKD